MSRKRKPIAIHAHARYASDSSGSSYANAVATIYFRDGSTASVKVETENGGLEYAVQRIGDALESAGYMRKRERYPFGGREMARDYFRDRCIPFITSERQVRRREL